MVSWKLFGWLRMNVQWFHGHGMWNTFSDQIVVICSCFPSLEILYDWLELWANVCTAELLLNTFYFLSTVRMDGGRKVRSDHVSDHPAAQLPGANSLNVVSEPCVTGMKTTLRDIWQHSYVSLCILQGGLGWDADVGIWEGRAGACRSASLAEWPASLGGAIEWWGKGSKLSHKCNMLCEHQIS